MTIVNKETNLTRETVTNTEGAYSVLNVLPGQYDVKICLTGFRENIRANVPVTIGAISRVDMSLELGTLTETVTVASAAQLLQTDKADVSTELRSAEITAIPLNRFRNYQALVNLVPGTTPMAFGNAETDTPARSLATNVNGQANTNNSTRTDGATNMNIWLPNHNMYISPAETIDTVNVSTSSFDAEQGMAGGAAVTVITKSGTNNFRGSAFEFFMNDEDERDAVLLRHGSQTGQAAPRTEQLWWDVRRADFAATACSSSDRSKGTSAPTVSPRSSACRRRRCVTAISAPPRTTPARSRRSTTRLRAHSGSGTGVGREPFANNQIPVESHQPRCAPINDLLYPLPNTTGIGLGGLTNNYQRNETRTVDRKNYDVKVNFNRTQAHQLWVKYSLHGRGRRRPDELPGTGSECRG